MSNSSWATAGSEFNQQEARYAILSSILFAKIAEKSLTYEKFVWNDMVSKDEFTRLQQALFQLASKLRNDIQSVNIPDLNALCLRLANLDFPQVLEEISRVNVLQMV